MENVTDLTKTNILAPTNYGLMNVKSFKITKEIIEDWINYLDRSENTKKTYMRNFRAFVNYLEARNIDIPDRDSIKAFRESLLTDHEDTTVYTYLMAVKSFFRWTALVGLYPDIADDIQGGKIEEGFRRDALTVEQATELLSIPEHETLKDKRDYAILVLMITTGLRTIEVVRADIGDIRTVMQERVLFVHGKGKTGKQDYVKLSKHADSAIRAYLKARGDKDKNLPLFASTSKRNPGNRLTTRTIRNVIGGFLDKAGLHTDRISAHSLRHTAGTLNMASGGTLEETKELLRHASSRTTQIYTHINSRKQNQSEQRLDNALFPLGGSR